MVSAFRHNSDIVVDAETPAYRIWHSVNLQWQLDILCSCPVVAIRMTYDSVSTLSLPRRGVALITLEPEPIGGTSSSVVVAICIRVYVRRIPPYVVG